MGVVHDRERLDRASSNKAIQEKFSFVKKPILHPGQLGLCRSDTHERSVMAALRPQLRPKKFWLRRKCSQGLTSFSVSASFIRAGAVGVFMCSDTAAFEHFCFSSLSCRDMTSFGFLTTNSGWEILFLIHIFKVKSTFPCYSLRTTKEHTLWKLYIIIFETQHFPLTGDFYTKCKKIKNKKPEIFLFFYD